MKKWNLIIDVDNCTNCNMCTLASKDEHVGNAFPGYSAEMPKRGAEWIKIEKKERGQTPMIDIGYIPTMCQHCDDAPCMKVAKNNAITKRNDGIIIIDPEKSKGQKQMLIVVLIDQFLGMRNSKYLKYGSLMRIFSIKDGKNQEQYQYVPLMP